MHIHELYYCAYFPIKTKTFMEWCGPFGFGMILAHNNYWVKLGNDWLTRLISYTQLIFKYFEVFLGKYDGCRTLQEVYNKYIS